MNEPAGEPVEPTPTQPKSQFVSALRKLQGGVPKELTSPEEWLEAFEADFWAEYPHRVGKFEARKSWMRIKPWTQQNCDQIFAGLARWNVYWNEQETEKRFMPYPATWLNQHRWEDEP